MNEDFIEQDSVLEESSGDNGIAVPPAITSLKMKNFLIGAVLIIFGIGFSIILKEMGLLVFSVFGAWFIYSGIVLDLEYAKGKICEMPVQCVNVQLSMFADSAVIGFETLDEEQSLQYMQFRISGKKRAEDFIQNGYYCIYYYIDKPTTLVAYTQV